MKRIKMNGYNATEFKGYINYLHRQVSEQHDGKVKKGWHVHHCDFEKNNNDIDNLVQIPEGLHAEIHRDYKKENAPSKKIILEIIRPRYMSKEMAKLAKINSISLDQFKDMARIIRDKISNQPYGNKETIVNEVIKIIQSA